MIAPKIPAFLRSHKAWVVWRLTSIPGEKKPRKMPYYVDGGKRGGTQEEPIEHGSPEDVSRLASFDEAVARCKAGGYTGLGFATLAQFGVVAYDLDDVVTNGVVLPGALKAVDGTYAEISPSGNGLRAFYRGALPGTNRKSLKPKDTQFKLEVFHSKGFVTVTGNVLEDCKLWGYDDLVADLTPAARALYEEHFETSSNLPAVIGDASSGDWMMSIMPPVGLSDEQIRESLAALPDDMEYEDWLRVGMAVHHETSGSDEGFDLWHEKSKLSSKYTTEKYSRDRWRSFGRNASAQPTTFRFVLAQPSVKALRIEPVQAVDDRYTARDFWTEELKREGIDERTIREELCPKISADTRLGSVEREQLAQLLRNTLKVAGVVVPIAQVRKLIEPAKVVRNLADGDKPTWMIDWCYVGTHDKFFKYDTDEWLSAQGFNAKFNRHMPRNEDGYIYKSASAAATDDYEIEHVNRAVYLPQEEQLFPTSLERGFFDMSPYGRCVNLYRPSCVPKADDLATAAGKGAVQVVLRHIMLIAGGRKDVALALLNWIAHNVQKPGTKIRWAPLIKGIEGDGKSTIGKLMAFVMGGANVKSVSPHVLAGDFTGWSEGSCVVQFEELRIAGENRYAILNSIKPYITNDTVPTHRKGKDEYQILNVTNYIGYTNFSDALPLDNNDRRWMVIFLPFADIGEMAAAVAPESPSLEAYFTTLNAVIEKHWAQLRRWLLDYPIPATFNPDGRAPMTDEKQSMIAMSMSDDERAVREAIEQGAEGVAQNALISRYLLTALSFSDAAATINGKELGRILTRIGFIKAPKIKWEGKTENVWFRGNPGRDIRAELQSSFTKAEETADPFA